MAVNTTQLDDGKYVTTSSISITASRATVAAQDVVATSTLSVPTGGISLTGTSAFSANRFVGQAGTALQPTFAFTSENSLGLYRSATSTLALSYGGLNTFAGRLSIRTAASLTSATMSAEEIAFDISGNTAQIRTRWGGVVWTFSSSASTVG